MSDPLEAAAKALARRSWAEGIKEWGNVVSALPKEARHQIEPGEDPGECYVRVMWPHFRQGATAAVVAFLLARADRCGEGFTLTALRLREIADEVERLGEEGVQMCSGCGVYPADLPSKICHGCEAYQEHQT